MFDRIRNAWSLAKASWTVLQQDRELAWLPVIGGVVALAVGLVFFGPFLAIMGGGQNEAIPAVGYLLLFAGYVAVTSIIFLSRAAVVHGANIRMDGGDPSLSTSMRGASSHWPAVVGFAAIATTVGLVLDMLREQGGILGSIVSWIGGTAWRVVTYLALPVIVIEGTGTIDGIKGSTSLVKRTWGEQVTGNVGFGLLNFVAVLPAGLVLFAGAATGITAIAVATFLIAVVWVIGVSAVIAALTAIFQTALYRQATGRSVPTAFDATELRHSISRA